MRYILLFLLITSISCQDFIKKDKSDNDEKLDSTFIDRLIPDNIIYVEGIDTGLINKDELNFLNYIYVKYNSTCRAGDFGFLSNLNYEYYLYDAKLFYENTPVSFIKKTKKYENTTDVIIFKKIYDKRGRINSINITDQSNFGVYCYYQGNNLSKIIENNETEQKEYVDGHNRTIKPPEKFTREIILNYLGSKLISKSYPMESFWGLNNIPSKKNTQCFQSIGNSTKTYIKAAGNVYGFEKGSLQFIASQGFCTDEYPCDLMLFNTNGNTTTIRQYLRYSGGKNGKEKVWIVRTILEIQRSVDYKLERLIITNSPCKNETPSIKDFYYEYNYVDKKLIGYNIFRDEYDLPNHKKDNNRKPAFKLMESYSLTK